MARWPVGVFLLMAAACGSSQPPSAPAADTSDAGDVEDAGVAAADADAAIPTIAFAEPPPAPSQTMSFEDATATPEPVEMKDDHGQLSDQQLKDPMRGVILSCKVPPSVKVTIKTAVQNGRAIGVTVVVDLNKPIPKKSAKAKKLTKAQVKAAAAAAKAEEKMVARIKTCADHNVRAITWPPSRRRDAITTTFN